MVSTGRAGITVMEVLVVLVVGTILVAIALPAYRNMEYRARAAHIVSGLNAVRTAAHKYEVREGEWPADVNPGVVPEPLQPFVAGVDFTGDGYTLDWDNWGTAIGISVIVRDDRLENALLAKLRTGDATFMRLGDRYMYFIESTPSPGAERAVDSAARTGGARAERTTLSRSNRW